MSRPHAHIFAVLAIVLFGSPAAGASDQQVFIQKDISAATIVERGSGYVVDVTILASDLEEVFQNAIAERKGIDLSQPGVLEQEIGKFVARRIALRDRDGNACRARVERSGEDPKNDEGVLVSLAFDCASRAAVYDAGKLLSALNRRAMQIVTVSQKTSRLQTTLNADRPTAALSE